MGYGFRVSADGFLDVRDPRRVRTPGKFDRTVKAAPEDQALSFLLSHAFPGHRRIIRCLRESDRKLITLAQWADSVGERMALVDRVWRSMTEPVMPPRDPATPELVQVVGYGATWAYPVYLDGEVTRVLPPGGVPMSDMHVLPEQRLDLRSA
jgi:hypothetical protein